MRHDRFCGCIVHSHTFHGCNMAYSLRLPRHHLHLSHFYWFWRQQTVVQYDTGNEKYTSKSLVKHKATVHCTLHSANLLSYGFVGIGDVLSCCSTGVNCDSNLWKGFYWSTVHSVKTLVKRLDMLQNYQEILLGLLGNKNQKSGESEFAPSYSRKKQQSYIHITCMSLISVNRHQTQNFSIHFVDLQ